MIKLKSFSCRKCKFYGLTHNNNNKNLLGFISMGMAEILRWLAKPITTLLLSGLGILRQNSMVPDTRGRCELLSIVKKQSKFLRNIDGQDSISCGSNAMDGQFWHEMLDLYFMHRNVSKGHEEDDLIFFVRDKNLHGSVLNDHMEDVAPFFVRRWAPSKQLEKLVGANMSEVDWACSFYLNLIAHTSFSVTVAICSIRALRGHQNWGSSNLSPVYKVVKTVFASPSCVNFQLDHKKTAETQPAYPNICFSIDDFDDTFDAVVLSEVDHCYCVVLNAHDGAAFPEIEIKGSDLTLHSRDETASKPPKVTLFSGFISYEMVCEAYGAGNSGLGSILSLGRSRTKTNRIFMRGHGEIEVAVSGIEDQSRGKGGLPSPRQLLRKGIGAIMHKASSAVAELTRHTYSGPPSNDRNNSNNDRSHRGNETILPLKCCLMSISLPWDVIAHDLLFKASPPLNL